MNRYPIGNIIYMFSVGYLLHMRITHPEFIAKFALKFIDMLSGKRFIFYSFNCIFYSIIDFWFFFCRALEITENLQSMATPYKSFK